MIQQKPEINELLDRAHTGDDTAVGMLLDQHRARLRQMIAVRIDPRLTARIDPSDVVQETLTEAAQKLSGYLQQRPVPFYPWLRKIAWERLVHLHEQHLRAQKRSVIREGCQDLALSNHSALQLVDRLIGNETSPSRRVVREEMRERVQKALEQLPTHHREVVILRHLEQLTFEETAAALGITEPATRSRYRRAVERLHRLLRGDPLGGTHDRP